MTASDECLEQLISSEINKAVMISDVRFFMRCDEAQRQKLSRASKTVNRKCGTETGLALALQIANPIGYSATRISFAE